jgi:hypothetical protein
VVHDARHDVALPTFSGASAPANPAQPAMLTVFGQASLLLI